MNPGASPRSPPCYSEGSSHTFLVAAKSQCRLAKVDLGSLEVQVPGVLPARLVPGRHDRRLWHRLGWWLAGL